MDVLHDLDIGVRAGEVLCLPGDDGAGEFTLIEIMSGVQGPSSGKVEMDGELVAFANPREAAEHGIFSPGIPWVGRRGIAQGRAQGDWGE